MNKSMKDKKIFSSKLYIEGLRQLKGIGIILLLINIIRVSMIYVYNKNSGSYTGYIFSRLANYLVVIAAVILTVIAFNFLNNRSKSDFYHSVPCSRTCLSISFFMSIFTWICIFLLPQLIEIKVLSGSMYGINGYIVLNQLLLALYIICGMMLGCSITGTTSSSVIVGVMVTFGPRFFVNMILNLLLKCCSVIPIAYISPIISGKYSYVSELINRISFSNTLFAGGYSYLYGDYYFGVGNSLNNDYILRILYSLVIIIIYFALALVMFRRRNSEMAEKMAENKYIQACFRIAFTMVICIFAIGQILLGINNKEQLNENISNIVAVYILAIIAYYLFEIVTTKKINTLLRITKGLLVVVVLNIVIIAGVYLTSEYVYNNIPEKDEVESFSLVYNIEDNKDVYLHLQVMQHLYKEYLRETTAVYDSECVEGIINTLETYRDYDYSPNPERNADCIVRINKKNGETLYRQIAINDNLVQKIVSAYENDSKYVDKMTTDLENIIRLSFFEEYGDEEKNNYLNSDVNKEILDTFWKEYNALNDEEKKTIWDTDRIYNERKFENVAYAVVKRDGMVFDMPLYLDDKFQDTKDVFNKEFMRAMVKDRFKNNPYEKEDVIKSIDRIYGFDGYYEGMHTVNLYDVFRNGYFELPDLTEEEVEILKDSIITGEENIKNPEGNILYIRFFDGNEYFIEETDGVKALIKNYVTENDALVLTTDNAGNITSLLLKSQIVYSGTL